MANIDTFEKSVSSATKAVLRLGNSINQTESRVHRIVSATEKWAEKNKDTAGFGKINDAIKKQRGRIKELIGDMVEYTKQIEKERKFQDDIRKVVALNAAGLGKYAMMYNAVAAKAKIASSALISFAGTLGVQQITWSGMIKTSLDYNKAMFDLSRTQNTVGKGFGDIGVALDYVRKNTLLSTNQFVILSSELLKGFVGVKPSMTEMAQTLGTITDLFAGNAEKAKTFFEIQSKFPALYREIIDGLETAKKINDSGNATEAEKQKLDAIRATVSAQRMAGEITQEYFEDVISGLKTQSAEEKRYQEILKGRVGMEKQVQQLQQDLAESFLPIQKAMMEGAKKAAEFMGKYKEAIVGVVVAAGTLKIAVVLLQAAEAARKANVGLGLMDIMMKKMAVSSIAAFWWVVPVAIAIGLIAYGALKWYDSMKKVEQEQKKAAENAELLKINEGEISKMTKIQREEYDKLWKTKQASAKTEDERISIQKEIIDAVKGEGDDVAILTKRYDEAKTNVERYAAAIQATADYMNVVIGATTDAGGRAKELQAALKEVQGQQLAANLLKFEEAAKAASGIINQMADKIPALKGMSIDINSSPDEMLNSYEKMLAVAVAAGASVEEINKLTAVGSQLAKAKAERVGLEVAQSKNLFDLHLADIKQMEQYTVIYEQRLDAERQLMESAQFGMGASIEMMQKQVDLAYTMMKQYADGDKALAEEARKRAGISQDQMKAIQNAKTQAEAENLIVGYVGKESQAYRELTKYAATHQEITTKIMKQQQKIYDLTKDIREGYLDAIREMSSGAGEFEKIIGTREMGVTQLMDAVEAVTGVARTNTMALGGLQEQALTKKGVGTNVTGRYTASGIGFIGKGEQEERNKRIYNYEDSVRKAKSTMAGDIEGGPSGVGSAVTTDAEKFLGEAREMGKNVGDNAYKGTYDGTRDAIKDFLGPINIGVRTGNAPGMEDSSKIRANAASAGALGANLANASKGSAPAIPNVPGVGKMPIPGRSDKDSKETGGNTLSELNAAYDAAKKEESRQQSSRQARKRAKEEKNKVESGSVVTGAAETKMTVEEEKIESLKIEEEAAKQKVKDLTRKSADIGNVKKRSRFGAFFGNIRSIVAPITASVKATGGLAKGAWDWGMADEGDKRKFSEFIPKGLTYSEAIEHEQFAGTGIDPRAKGKLRSIDLQQQAQLSKAQRKAKERKKLEEDIANRKKTEVAAKQAQEDAAKQAQESVAKQAQEDAAKKLAFDEANKEALETDARFRSESEAAIRAQRTGIFRTDKDGERVKVGIAAKAKGMSYVNAKGERVTASSMADIVSEKGITDKSGATGETGTTDKIDALASGYKALVGGKTGKEAFSEITQQGASGETPIYMKSAEEFKTALQARKRASTMSGKGTQKTQAKKGYTSAAEERGEASEEAQKNWTAAADQFAHKFGADTTGGGSASGGGIATIIVKFAEGLDGDVKEVRNLKVELQNAGQNA